MANRTASLAPVKGAGTHPKADEITKKLLQEELKSRPAELP
jgi:hypothetical protein